MKKYRTTSVRRAIIAFGLLIGVVSFFLMYRQLNEPIYEGKTLSQWIRTLEYENLNPPEELGRALRAMGPSAVTRLIAMLETIDSSLKRKFTAYARSHPAMHNRFIAPRHVIPEEVYHVRAATALGEIGPSAKAAIPALEKVSAGADKYLAARATAALIKIEQQPVTPWIAILEDTESTNWSKAALTMKYLGTDGRSAVPLLVKGLQSTNSRAQYYAVEALGGIASRPDIAVPALLEYFQRNGGDRDALDALCKFKSAKPQIVPLLLSSLQTADANLWLGAAFGLEELLSPEEKKSMYVPALIQSLNNSEPAIRENAALFLKRVDSTAAAKAGIK
jgi:hypothetical protein